MKASHALLLTALLGVATMSTAKKPSMPRHMAMLIGDWDLTVYKYPLQSKQASTVDEDYLAPTTIHVSLKQRNDTHVLDGFYLFDEFESKEFVQINFLDDLTGEVLVSKPEAPTAAAEAEEEDAEIAAKKAAEDDAEEFEGGDAPAPAPKAPRTAEMAEFVSLLKFALSNESAGHHITQGAFGESGSYQAVFTDKARGAFSATVFENGKDYFVTVLAKKAFIPEPSFFQKYSTFIMIAFFLVTNFFKKTPPPPPAATQDGNNTNTTTTTEGDATPAAKEASAKTTTSTKTAPAPAKQGGGNKKGKGKKKSN